MKTNHLLIAILIFCFQGIVAGQNQMCNTSLPFCAAGPYTYPAGTSGQAEPGAYYACMTTQPAPAWFHMLIDDPGSITIYMYSSPLVDIDFVCWGPFDDPHNPCVAGLTPQTTVDCSYSPNPTEYCNIPNGQTGQYYILLITNYSRQPAEITFSQVSGNGSLDCSLLSGPEAGFYASPLEGTAPLTVQFSDTSSGNPSNFKWDFQNDGIYDAFVQNPEFTYESPGHYSVKLLIQNTEGADSLVKEDYIYAHLAPGLPDLLVQDSYVWTQHVSPGQHIVGFCKLQNQGEMPAGASILNYYFSTDTINDDSDTLLSFDYCNALDAGQDEYLADTMVVPANAVADTAYILFVADADQQVEESDENNNLAYFEIVVDTLTRTRDLDNPGKDVKIYPNPATDKLMVDLSGLPELPEKIDLFNSMGMELAGFEISGNRNRILEINLENYPPGTYFLLFRLSNETFHRVFLILK